ncbi:hypothetical protein THII_3539 [Thioploca ingrica]|uniref:Right handed beta helix domain-containing protein n=1 Tax=Thioploca ingrica TaxID=40754 RepID=A0A090BW19_9GAMM|nr:hypothetical protein THII_3539 [Thioploca ingrica]
MQPFLKLSLFCCLVNTVSCFASDLWVDTLQGKDNQDGLTPATALHTVQMAANLATPGTTIHIQPGIYRETLHPMNSGTAEAPIIYRAEQGVGSVIIRGSESASSLVWTPLIANNIGLPAAVEPKNIVWTDLSAWNLTQAPRFVMQLDAAGKILAQLQPSREPDWPVQTEWKYHEFWWSAEGGSEVASCDPPTDKNPQQCDNTSRSLTQLTDLHNDSIPIGVEPGNLTTLGNLTGATLVVMDALQGHFTYRRTITNHEINVGRVTLDPAAPYNTLANPGLGWGSKYYLENHPALLDNPGEYWFDAATQRLYLWPLTTDLSQLEISRRDSGWDLTNLSYLRLEGLVLEFFNDKAILIQNGAGQSSYGNQLRHLQVRYANHGLFAEQMLTTQSPFSSVISGLVIADSEFGYLDTRGLSLLITGDNNIDTSWFTYAPIVNTLINNNEFHHLGFRSQNNRGIGILFEFADHLRFEANHVHHVAQDGVVFSGSIIQAAKTFDFTPAEIKTGDILLYNNLIEHTCQNADDCGGVTFSGTAPQRHVFHKVVIMGNTFRYIYGWSFVAEQRKRWANGYFGFGLYLLDVSGIDVYRNLAYNNGWAGIFLLGHWRDGSMRLYNNLVANSTIGINIWNSKEIETHDSVDTQMVNNILINNEYHGINLTANPQDTHLRIDHNLYYANSWGSGYGVGVIKVEQKSYPWLEDIQSQTGWELNGISEEDPRLFSYDYRAQRQRGDDSVLDWEIKRGSAAIDKGTASLPASLPVLLAQFNIQDNPQVGIAWDIGPFEYLESHQPLHYPGTATAMATQQPQDTQAQFTGFVTTGFVTHSLDQRGNHLILAQSDKAKVMAEIDIAPDDIGQLGQLGMVAAYTPAGINQTVYFMRQGTQWIPWDENLSTLVPAQIDANLPLQFKLFSPIEVTVYEGRLQDLPGHFTIYVGYILANEVVFNGQQPLEFTVQ